MLKIPVVFVWGEGEVASALATAIGQHAGMRLAASSVPQSAAMPPERTGSPKPLANEDAVLASEANCVILAPSLPLSGPSATGLVCRLLAAGKNVVTLIPIENTTEAAAAINTACRHGGTSLHVTGLFPHLLFDRMALVLSRALTRVHEVRIVQRVEVSALPEDLATQLARSGITATGPDLSIETRRQAFASAAPGLMASLTGTCPGQLTTSTSRLATASANAPVTIVHEASADGALRLIFEENWYFTAAASAPAAEFLYGESHGPLAFSVHLNGEPSRLDTRIELEPTDTSQNPLASALARHVIAAIPAVCSAAPGILLRDAMPRYRLDDRLPSAPGAARKTASGRRKRIVIWGPGEIGGAVTRAALSRDDLEIVGAKVFSPHKHGRDLGELVGIDRIGIHATLSAEDILALKPDCIVMAPQPRAVVEGLDRDVIRILESGINVITSAAYHNVSMPNWLASAQSPSALFREVAHTRGMARNRREELALSVLGGLVSLMDSGIFARVLPPLLDRILTPALGKHFRATPRELLAACAKGGSALHGTGVHPTFMAERVAMSLAGLVDDVRHVRFIEAADFSFMPDGMWGGLDLLGFGRPVEELDERFLIARAGDFYYGDVIGNVAHMLYGVPNSSVRVERSFRAIPAERDIKVGSTVIRKGCAAALHMTHKGHLGTHHFFTNEECWYLGPDREFRGEQLPFGNFATPLSYTVDVAGASQRARMQLSMDGVGRAGELLRLDNAATADQRCTNGQLLRKEGISNPITNATAMAILDAVVPVCEMRGHGVVIDDVLPAYRNAEKSSP